MLKPFLSLQVPSAIGCGTLTAGPAGQTSPSPARTSASAASSPSWVLKEKTKCRSFWERKMLPFLSERGGERLGRGCRAQAHGSILPHCATFQSLSPRVYPRTLLPCSRMSAEGADTGAALPRSLSDSNLCKGVWCLLVSSQPWRLQNENLGFRVPKQLTAVQKSNFFLINYFNNTHNAFSCRNVSNT